ncbi:MAG: autotransporter outer membrane beta-barrel domain-containing protein [Chloroflexi bacterium]|nr:autotransporter outer membrane beta-barrel domain-containing protein [Chloroflexota bacterium]
MRVLYPAELRGPSPPCGVRWPILQDVGMDSQFNGLPGPMALSYIIPDRKGINTWPDIWLRPASPDYEFVGGGITILESRTRDVDGVEQVAFTSGHIAFRQSLLVRAEDAQRYASHDDLGPARVAALGGTTGEHRLLVLTGVVGAEGNLAAGTAIHLADGTSLTADGSAHYQITAAGSSENLANRVRIEGPSGSVKEVLIMSTDQDQLDALASGRVDAVARGELGNREASRNANSRFVVTALDPAVEYGGFAFDRADQGLAECVDARINYLTDHRRVGVAEWLDDSQVFLQRARYWNATEALAQIYAYSALTELVRERFNRTLRYPVDAGDALSGPDSGGLWLRVRYGGRRNENAHADSRPFDGGSWREDRSELQVGVSRPLDGLDIDLRAGFTGHVFRVVAEVENGRSTAGSHAEALGYGGGASLTWFGKRGPYAATEARYSRWEADVSYRRRELSAGIDGHSWGVSAETGWRFGGGRFRMTPRLRVAWTGVGFDRFTDSDGVAVRQEHDAALDAALGLEVGIVVPESGVRLYGDLEFVHDFEEDSAIAAYGYQFRSGLADSWARLQVGVRKEFSPRVSAMLSSDFGVGLDPDNEGTSMWNIRAALHWAL